MSARCRALWAALLAFLPAPAHAHAPIAGAGEFYAGLLHPLTDPQAIPSLLALGLLAGRAGKERGLWTALVGSATAFAAGLIATLVGWLPVAPLVLALATLVAALLLAADVRLPAVLLFALAMVLGAALGIVQASELPSAEFGAGAALGIALALLYLALFAARIEAPWARIGVRVAGSWIAAVMVLMLGLTLR